MKRQPSLEKLYAQSLEDCLHSKTWAEASITVVHKRGEKSGLIASYHLVSLINTNYKILITILADHLNSFLSKYIKMDQTGFLKGRSLFWNIRRLIILINLVSIQQCPTLFYFIAAEKAFDHIKWIFYRKF